MSLWRKWCGRSVGQFWQMDVTLRYLLMWHSEIEIVHYWVVFLSQGSGICTLISAPPWGLCMKPRPPSSTVGQLQWFWKKKKKKHPTNARGRGMISMSFHDSASHFSPTWNFSFLAKAPFSTSFTKNQIDHTTKVVCPRPSPGFIGFWRSLSFDLPSQPFWMKRQKNGGEQE